MIIGVDVDGVLAQFSGAYAGMLTVQTGIGFPAESDEWPNTWYWDRAAGVTKADESAVWRQIKSSDNFWFGLPPYSGAVEFLVWLKHFGYDTYFVTNRSGPSAKHQTERWLHKSGFPEPTVLISQEKDLACRAVEITHYIDDKNENCKAVANYAPLTHCYMLKRPWNEPLQMVPRLDSLKDFQQILMLARLEGK